MRLNYYFCNKFARCTFSYSREQIAWTAYMCMYRDEVCATKIMTTDWNEITSQDAMNTFERGIKRGADIVCSMLALVLLSPVFLLIYVILKLDGCKKPLLRQERIGYRGMPFILYKYRTMVTDAEADGVPQLAVKNDARLTKVGKFLREYHLDELPQFWNVLMGDMSMVGPRPERKYFINKIMKINPNYSYVYAMRPGLTSRATIENGYTDTMEKMLRRLEMDIEYLRTRSLWGDCVIIGRTLVSFLSGQKF